MPFLETSLKEGDLSYGVLITSEIVFLHPTPHTSGSSQCKSACCVICFTAWVYACHIPLGMLLDILYLHTIETQKAIAVFEEVLSMQLREVLI